MQRDNIALTEQQFQAIMEEIKTYHRFGGLPPAYWDNPMRQSRCKHIKYVRPDFDLRDEMCFHIRFDPGEKVFGSGAEETVPMYDRIMEWLNTPRD